MDKPLVTQVPAHTNNYSKNIYPKTGIVLHWIVGSLASADKTFQDPGRIASVQYGIGKNGEIHQYIDDKYTAFHAGVSNYNQNYFGIEHEGGHLYNGERVKPSQACHESSIRLVAWLCKTYNIPCDRKHIVKHSETGYATQCCGTLDIDYIVSEASKLLNSNSMAQWCIDKAIRDAAASNMDTFLNKYRKDVKDAGVDPVEWWVRNGSAEVPAMYEKLVERIANLELVNKTNADTIAKLNASIGGLTTDRNKYQQLSVELQAKYEGEIAEVNRLKNELESTENELKITSSKLLLSEQELDNLTPAKEQLEKKIAELEGSNNSLVAINKILEKKLKEAQNNKKGITIAELLTKILNALRNVFKKRR